jgi:hypothetical protein
VTSLTPASYHAASARSYVQSSAATYLRVGLAKYCIRKLLALFATTVMQVERYNAFQFLTVAYLHLHPSYLTCSFLPVAFTCPSYCQPPSTPPPNSPLLNTNQRCSQAVRPSVRVGVKSLVGLLSKCLSNSDSLGVRPAITAGPSFDVALCLHRTACHI